MKPSLTHFVFDVDGVFTTGQFLYTNEGKFAKVFGPHDADGIKEIKKYMQISAISADKRGFAITKKRIQDDMGIPLELISEPEREKYFSEKHDMSKTVYMADGIHDAPLLRKAAYGIAPHNAYPTAIQAADYVTNLRSGEGAVAEACYHVLEKFFTIQL
ncbi:MAG TPA: HAD hydrolase family protein [Candidatus Andersenbacteria bacterium]|nr:HAD hydrolase family protein [Candidatus Andersenbacteria bacterium]